MENVIEIIKENILWNCEARVEVDDKAEFVAVGNGTECGLIKFLQDNEIQVNTMIRVKEGRILTQIPFSSYRCLQKDSM